MDSNLPLALSGIYAHIGHMLHCICGPDENHDLLLMEVVYRDGMWWLSGYDNADLAEPLDIDAASVTEWVEATRGDQS